jgi:hypothetical protein
MSLTLVSVGFIIYNNEKKNTVLFLQLGYWLQRNSTDNHLIPVLPEVGIEKAAALKFTFRCFLLHSGSKSKSKFQ